MTDVSDWASAATDMNDALKEAGYTDYQYVENTDAATKESFPLILVSQNASD